MYIAVTERDNLQKNLKRQIYRCSKVVYNIKPSFACSEFTVHMQNQLQAGSFAGTKVAVSHDAPIFPNARAPKLTVSR